MNFKDKTFCGSPNCNNECGRKMTEKERKELEKVSEDNWHNLTNPENCISVCYANFCGEV